MMVPLYNLLLKIKYTWRMMFIRCFQNNFNKIKKNQNEDCAQEIWQVKVPKLALPLTSTSPICTPRQAKIPQLPVHLNARGHQIFKNGSTPTRQVHSCLKILTPRDTITWVRDQMNPPPMKFLRLTQLTFLIYQN